MKAFSKINEKKLWFYPLLYGVLGALMGLVLRYAFTGSIPGFLFKNVLHSHSHVMLLGFVFNALIVLLWTRFSEEIDSISLKLYYALQICMGVLLVAFIIQGYAFITILFSTFHLWIGYALLIRLWKRLKGNKEILALVKFGIIFHFISSLGPYALGPLKAMQMQDSPWYQQAIFFYLHFQYLGSFFLWTLAVLFEKCKISFSKKQLLVLVSSCVLLYAHSLNFNFNHGAIQWVGGLGALLLFVLLVGLKNNFKVQKKQYQILYAVLLLMALCNCIGSTSYATDLVVGNRFILIAWLHFLFLGIYLPFIWIELPKKISKYLWVSYVVLFSFTELLLVFPSKVSAFLSVPIMWLLFLGYLGVVFCICIVHLTSIFEATRNEFTRTR